MKKLMISLLLVVTTVMSANAMSKYRASREARFLTDKMAWELDLTPMQIEDVYEINYDYFRSLVSVHTNYTREYEIRNEELRFVLTPWQWERFIVREYFFTPVRVVSYAWHFAIYNFYRSDRFFFDAPRAYSHYRGGHALNRDYYSGRRDIHHPGGNFRPAPAPKPEPKPLPRAERNRPAGNIHNGGNHSGANFGGKHDGGNVGQSRPNNGGGNVAPNRNTPNRSNSANSKPNTNTRNGSSTARPTRSQQNQGSHSATSGRR